ncbi:hypothetical protein YC2023_056405 [Brassica napus]
MNAFKYSDIRYVPTSIYGYMIMSLITLRSIGISQTGPSSTLQDLRWVNLISNSLRLKMAMAPATKLVLAFAIFLVFISFPFCTIPTNWSNRRFSLAAMLMVIFQVITPEQAYP